MGAKKVILSLCDVTGNWPSYYREDDRYEVISVDIQKGQDVRLLEYMDRQVHGVLAAPPCTEFASSGARWWAGKSPDLLYSALTVADACLRAVAVYNPVWWALENPIGRLNTWYGPPRFRFNPNEFAGWLEDGSQEAYTKRTCLWGRFTIPEKKPLPPVLGSKMHLLPPSKDRQKLRSVTPLGFSKAFYLANQ